MSARSATRARRRRGTALLLAVGLVTILAILGSTFLVTSLLDAKQSEALAVKAQAEPLARGALERVRRALTRDLHAAANRGPYGGLDITADEWRNYIDYPSEDADPHLASVWDEQMDAGGNWRHLTNLTGRPASEVENVPPDVGSQQPYVDTDGDEEKDALLVDTGVSDARGNRYMMAVRVTDLAARKFLPDEDAPSGAVRLVNLCYGPGEEMFLHWYRSNAPTNIGRFYTRLDDDEPDWDPTDRSDRRALTTYNCTRPLLRHPTVPPAVGEEPRYTRLMITARQGWGLALNDKANRDRLFQALKDANPQGGILSPAERDAAERRLAHFVANLWAYMSPEEAHENPFAFEYRKNRYVYGLVEQLVISEVYAWHWAETNPDDTQLGQGEAYALEMINPTDAEIDVSNYRFGVYGGDSEEFPADVTVAPGDRIVIYSVAGDLPDGAGGTETAQPSDFDFQLDGQDGDTYWHRADDVEALNFMEHNQNYVWREIDGHKIPVDFFDADVELDFNPDPKPPAGISRSQTRTAARDDNLGRMRVTVGHDMALIAQHDNDTSESARQDHTLGDANNLSAAELGSSGWSGVHHGFDIHRRNYADYVDDRTAPLDSLGEITRIYLYGPEEHLQGGTDVYRDFPNEIEAEETALDRGRPNVLGAVPGGPTAYPDVPWACVVQELIDRVPPPLAAPTDRPASQQFWAFGGRLNVNTARRERIEELWPEGARVEGLGFFLRDADRRQLAEAIIDYRDLNSGPREDDPYGSARGNVPDLRTEPDSDIPGFLTPGEVAIPVTRWAEDYLAGTSLEPGDPDYHAAREWFYRTISDKVAVHSDAYAVNIVIQLQPRTRDGGAPNYEQPVNRWTYMAVVDRSTCYGPGARPAVRLFSEVK